MRESGEHRLCVGGISHWVRIAGAGKSEFPLVIVHGGPGTSAHSLEEIGDRLAESVTVVLYDQRGCGRSEIPGDPATYTFAQLVDDLEDLRAALGYGRISLLGHSFGAVLAAEYTVTHPGRVRSLVMSGPPVVGPLHPGPLALRAAAVDAYATPATRKALREAAIAASDRIDGLRRTGTALRADEATMNRTLYHRAIPEPDTVRPRPSAPVNQEMAWRLIAAIRPGLVDDLADVDPPTLVTVGLWDVAVGVDGPRDLSVRLPRGTLRLFLESAHSPHLEEPAEFSLAIRRFLLSA
ncbi:alpha/beta fold hydrolase [Mangrovihabitans endophyticus]|uniref:Proline iminopeptidase n=1 Tax=Mangrovihabitans endophyticus TaxID=1751298 RepID=A0A8J3BW11_9ACTN|nr:alpha/beta fold hydrolase [Mangrovihabitans endophyticus]GGK72625.1 proline iminopeptidase [Mangrovihabitans endophyticus]